MIETFIAPMIEHSPLAVHVFAPDGRSLLTNEVWRLLWGDGEASEGSNVFEEDRLRVAGLTPYMREVASGGGAVTTPPLLDDPGRVGRANGPRWLKAFVYPIKDAGEGTLVVLAVEDVTEAKAREERLVREALRDPLTGLPNRALLSDRLEHAMSRAQRQEDEVAVLFLDLDDFKVVNDSLGHGMGDRLLVEVSERLSSCLRAEDTAARWGGDEFVILLKDSGGLEAARVARRIEEVLKEPFLLDGQEVLVTSSIGIALGGSAGGSPSRLLRNADLAMYRAKQGGKARHKFFEEKMDAPAARRLEMRNELRRATRQGEFVVHYQPEVEVETGRVVAMEALVRWQHPDRGLLAPAEFMPTAEETGLIVPIGRWVLGEACRRAKGWQELYPSDPPLGVNVNLSARELRLSDLVEHVEEALRDAGLEAGRLTLEVTESATVEDELSTADTLQRMRELGVRLALDDFGTGYSSFSRVRRLPVDSVKLDRSFLKGLGPELKAWTVMMGVVTLARTLGLPMVVEGVENHQQLGRLRTLRCDLAQGYHFCKPLSAEAATGFLAARL